MDLSPYILNSPTPGESMTSPIGAYPHENPPLIDSASEALKYILDSYWDRNLDKEVLKMAVAGIPLEYLSNVIVKLGYVEGIYTPDVAEIIKPVVLLHLLADARDAGVEKIRIFTDATESKIDDSDFIALYDEFRGNE